ncbi:MAG TPA: type II toxin-antitoxin system mRNA interferase toxin, RelE/StbE family [Patescibacteria group bacterium]
MQFAFSPLFKQKLKKIKKLDKKLFAKVDKQLKIFTDNPKHPSLRTHKLTGKNENVWSISITMSIRLVYKIIDDNIYYFVDIGTHDEVYKK